MKFKQINEKKEHEVFWAPWRNLKNPDLYTGFINPWAYEEPENLWSSLISNKANYKEYTPNIFQCPAVRETMESVYIIRNPTDSDANIEFDENKVITGVTQDQMRESPHLARYSTVESTMAHLPSINNQILFVYNFPMLFFSTTPLMMRLTSPWFGNAPHLKYGAVIPGTFDIGRWFRPLNFEFNLWDDVTRFEIKAEEPLAYVEFATDKKIVFTRFECSQKLFDLSNDMILNRRPKLKTLASRYDMFDKNPMRNLILNELAKNIAG